MNVYISYMTCKNYDYIKWMEVNRHCHYYHLCTYYFRYIPISLGVTIILGINIICCTPII